MIRWPKCADNGGPKECLGHIEQHPNGRLICDECGFDYTIYKSGDKITFIIGKSHELEIQQVDENIEKLKKAEMSDEMREHLKEFHGNETDILGRHK